MLGDQDVATAQRICSQALLLEKEGIRVAEDILHPITPHTC